MLKILFFGLIVVHGLIHLLGFLVAYGWVSQSPFNQDISKLTGSMWLIGTLAFLLVAVLMHFNQKSWFALGIVSVLLSQGLIIMSWKDAFLGTFPNVVILIVLLLHLSAGHFEGLFHRDVTYNFAYNNEGANELISEEDIAHLPLPVQKYLKYVGVLDKAPIKNFYAAFDGTMKDGQRTFSFESEQYNFFQEPSRLFFMKGKIYGLTVPGYHKYMGQEASMDIKLFGLLPLVNENNDMMFKSETVTTFVEMCFFAPSCLVDKRITWEEIDAYSSRAYFSNKNTRISATLHFNSEGQLINFVSDDRYAISEMKSHRFSTPVSNYKEVSGYKVPNDIQLIWHYPEGDFVYGTLRLKQLLFNLEKRLED